MNHPGSTPSLDSNAMMGLFSDGTNARPTPTLVGLAGGQLNPEFVEWLMGFPIGWTDLDASETP